MKIKSFIYLSSLSALTIFAGCSDDDESPVDNTAPTVSNVAINGTAENIVVMPGSEIHFDAQFEDDLLLGQYKIDIHNNFDGHSHGRIASTDFSFTQIYDLTGRTEAVHEHIEVPEDATPGDYHFSLQYFDAVGNEGDIVFLEFDIADPANQPQINITSHNVNEAIEVHPGGQIALAGTIEDPDGLQEVHIQLMLPNDEHDHDGHAHGRLSEDPLFDLEIPLDGVNSWNLDQAGEILIPEDAAVGHYDLTIRVTDLEGFENAVSIEVHIE